jgi:DNA polymerase I-like protein with 3'-5' exonuclease and polymerase domains
MNYSPKSPEYPEYTVVKDIPTLKSVIKPLFKAKVLALDCETTGLDPLTDTIRLIQIAVPNYPVVIIDLPAIYKSNNLEHNTIDKRTKINRLLLNKLFCNSALKIAHNAKFEWQFLTQAGLQISGRFFDTQLAYQVLNAGIKSSASLENVTRKLLRIQLDKTLQTSNWNQHLTSEQLQYAALVTGKLITEVTEEDRRLAKAINFGLIYGMGAAKLRIYAETKYGVTMTLESAKAFRTRFFDAYSGVTKWHETIKKAYLRGVKESRTLAGRRRRWADKPRLAEMLNHPVQGLNADINKLAMVKLVKPLSRTNARLICVVHDEIVLECPENEIEQVSRILHRCMVAAAEKFLNPVPVVVDVSVGDSW